MQRILATMTSLACALWAGGLMWLFLSVQTLFSHDRPTALAAAPRLFLAFERYQLALATAGLLGSAAWYFSSRRRSVAFVCLMLALATIGAIAGPILITRPMEQLRSAGESGTAQFKRLHGLSMMVYVGQAIVVLIATVMIPRAITSRGQVEAAPLGSSAR
jgi:hypothetical protein